MSKSCTSRPCEGDVRFPSPLSSNGHGLCCVWEVRQTPRLSRTPEPYILVADLSHSRTCMMIIFFQFSLQCSSLSLTSKTKEQRIEAKPPLGPDALTTKEANRWTGREVQLCTGSDHHFSAVCWNATCRLRRCDLDSLEVRIRGKWRACVYMYIYI